MPNPNASTVLVMIVAAALAAGSCGADSGGHGAATAGSAGAAAAGSGGSDAGISASRVGSACEPEQVPEGGFDVQEAYLEFGNSACGVGDACLVYRVAGDPRVACRSKPGACSASDPGCTGAARCADATDVQARVHCSCRCDGPAGQGSFCACPESFTCAPVIEQGPAQHVGSYCTRLEH
jgi:hypothetical protein